jgi:hypothetical protein
MKVEKKERICQGFTIRSKLWFRLNYINIFQAGNLSKINLYKTSYYFYFFSPRTTPQERAKTAILDFGDIIEENFSMFVSENY